MEAFSSVVQAGLFKQNREAGCGDVGVGGWSSSLELLLIDSVRNLLTLR